MPSSNHKQQHKGTTNQPVVQAIVDSLTRCFSPIVGSDEYGTGRCPSTTTTTTTANTRRHTRGDGTSSNKSRRSSTSSSTTAYQHKPNNNNNKGTYDADRYIHRKLEIFRTTDEECLAEFGIPHPRPSKRHKSSSSYPNRKKDKEGKEEKGGNNHHRNQSANTLVYSSEDQSEEIDNITQVQLREKQRQQQANANSNNASTNNSNGGGNLSNILNILRNPFNCINELHELQTKNGLCFANPVHDSAEDYDNLNMGDWNLTNEEFKKFKEEGIPDVDESSASLDGGDDEEQTMTSASYFDQKYSHIKITNPPMLLYTEHRVKYEEFDDHIFQIVDRRKKGYNVHTTTASKSSPTSSNIVLKKNNKLLESKFKARRDKRKNSLSKGGGYNKRNDDENVVPLAKSSSVSADSVTDPALAAAVC